MYKKKEILICALLFITIIVPVTVINNKNSSFENIIMSETSASTLESKDQSSTEINPLRYHYGTNRYNYYYRHRYYSWREAHVTGMIVDNDIFNHRVPGVSVYSSNLWSTFDTSDYLGKFQITVKWYGTRRQDVTILLERAGYYDIYITGTVSANTLIGLGTIYMTSDPSWKRSTIKGKILDRDTLQPVPDVKVSVDHLSSPSVQLFSVPTYADNDGNYSIEVFWKGSSSYFRSQITYSRRGYGTLVTSGDNISPGMNDLGVDLLISGTVRSEKIAVFFYASDFSTQGPIDYYVRVLKREGYTKFFLYRDCIHYREKMREIDAYETVNDVIFIYMYGSGHYNPNSDVSFVGIAKWNGYGAYPSSLGVKEEILKLETRNKGLLIESPSSQGFVTEFGNNAYVFVVATSTYPNGIIVWKTSSGYRSYGDFSMCFFKLINNGAHAIQCFWLTKNYYMIKPSQGPSYYWGGSYLFFN